MRRVIRSIRKYIIIFLKKFFPLVYWIVAHFPLEKKVVASSFYGRIYGDNPKYIIEKIHELRPDIKLYWIVTRGRDYQVPEYVTKIKSWSVSELYHMATARVWVNSHRIRSFFKKKDEQLFIETWHGGLGLKKIDNETEKYRQDKHLQAELKNTSKVADYFISNSDFLTDVFRRAMNYNGKVWKTGFPKNDYLVNACKDSSVRKKVCDYYGITDDSYFVLYVPTFRDNVRMGQADVSAYNMDYNRVIKAFAEKTGKKCRLLLRMHPFTVDEHLTEMLKLSTDIVNCTAYPSIEELIIAADAVISDFSSCIFDAALAKKSCFLYASDWIEYENDRGLLFKPEQLPFSVAMNNDELEENIKNFDFDEYYAKYQQFANERGLYETGRAAETVARDIIRFLDTGEKKSDWE